MNRYARNAIVGRNAIASWTITKVTPQTAAIAISAASDVAAAVRSRSCARQPPPALRAHSRQRALGAARGAGDAGAAPMADQQHVRLVGGLRRRARTGARARHARSPATPFAARGRAALRRGRRGCPPARRGGRRRTAGRTPRSCDPPRAARRAPGARLRAERPRASPDRRRRSRRGSGGCEPTWSAPGRPGGSASSTSSRGASRTSSHVGEALAQARVGDVAVAVVGVLGEHREDQLVDRAAVRAQHRAPVLAREPVDDPAQPAAVGHRARRLCVLEDRTVEIVERHTEVAGLEVHWRQASDAPILYVHGVPTASWDWEPLLERCGGRRARPAWLRPLGQARRLRLLDRRATTASSSRSASTPVSSACRS